jgi:hypothetical protein
MDKMKLEKILENNSKHIKKKDINNEDNRLKRQEDNSPTYVGLYFLILNVVGIILTALVLNGTTVEGTTNLIPCIDNNGNVFEDELCQENITYIEKVPELNWLFVPFMFNAIMGFVILS